MKILPLRREYRSNKKVEQKLEKLVKSRAPTDRSKVIRELIMDETIVPKYDVVDVPDDNADLHKDGG